MGKQCVLCVACLLVGASANADRGFRCGTYLINVGDHQAKVAAMCGDPDYTESRTILRGGIPRQDFRPYDPRSYSSSREELLIHDFSLVEVEAEVWVFNKGRRRFMREVVFLEGRVSEVNTLGYGY